MTGAVGTATGTTAATMPRIVQYGRSPRYRTRLGAVFAGARRQEEGICVAALVTWTGLPLALWVAALGALAGALLGAFGFTPTGLASDLHLNESVGVLGAVLGALGGLAAGFAVIYLIFFHSLAAFAGAVLSGLIVGSVTLWVLLVAEPLAMAARGYRELSRRESERLYPLLQRAGARMGLSVVPALWISDSQKPAAWSHPGAIVVTRGLLGEADASEAGPRSDLDDGALGAILAHELHHWAVGDPVGLRAVWACCWPVVAIYNAAAWLRTRSGVLGAIGWLLLWPAWLTVKLIVVPVMASASRQNEYEADWAAAGLGDDYRLGLRRALTELAVWEKPRTGWEDALAATHPPVELRLERLEAGYGTASRAGHGTREAGVVCGERAGDRTADPRPDGQEGPRLRPGRSPRSSGVPGRVPHRRSAPDRQGQAEIRSRDASVSRRRSCRPAVWRRRPQGVLPRESRTHRQHHPARRRRRDLRRARTSACTGRARFGTGASARTGRGYSVRAGRGRPSGRTRVAHPGRRREWTQHEAATGSVPRRGRQSRIGSSHQPTRGEAESSRIHEARGLQACAEATSA